MLKEIRSYLILIGVILLVVFEVINLYDAISIKNFERKVCIDAYKKSQTGLTPSQWVASCN